MERLNHLSGEVPTAQSRMKFHHLRRVVAHPVHTFGEDNHDVDPSFLELACESLRVEIGQKISDARRVVEVEMNLPVAVVE